MCSLKAAEKFPPPLQSNVREPGVNPGRLRHCNGYNSQCHCRTAGRREEVRCPSQDTGLIALVWEVDDLNHQPTNFSAKRRMRPVRQTVFGGIRRVPSFSVLWNEGFCFQQIENLGRFNASTFQRFNNSPASTLVSQPKPLCKKLLRN